MIIVLTTLNLPLDAIGMLISVEWFLDRLRTVVNVFGDTIGVACISALLIHTNEIVTLGGTKPENDIIELEERGERGEENEIGSKDSGPEDEDNKHGPDTQIIPLERESSTDEEIRDRLDNIEKTENF